MHKLFCQFVAIAVVVLWSEAAAAELVPFKTSETISVVEGEELPGGLFHVIATGSGVGTHLGKYGSYYDLRDEEVVFDEEAMTLTFNGSGDVIFTAANEDQLFVFLVYSVVLNLIDPAQSETFGTGTIVGGTGRFAGATGDLEAKGEFNALTDVSVIKSWGVISSPGRAK